MLNLEKIKLFFFEEPVSATIENGEILGIIGQSGSGKTSLLKSIKGFFPLEQGSVILDGEVINQNTDYRIGFVHQQALMFPHWSIKKNIIFGDQYVRGTKKEECLKKLNKIAEAFNLTHVLDKEVHNLSVGEKQRLGIARCIMMDPYVILMDEPSSALDPANVKNLCNMILKLKQAGVIFVIASHDMSLIKMLCDKIIFLSEGKAIFNGTAAAFWINKNKQIEDFTHINNTV
jgi:ABC-type multidrug transport system ATPase subunit